MQTMSVPSSSRLLTKQNDGTWLLMLASAVVTTGATVVVWRMAHQRQQQRKNGTRTTSSAAAYESLIGHTPCIRLPVLSGLLQRGMYVKCEHFNPGGTGKDRAALSMIQDAEMRGLLPSNPNGSSGPKEEDHDLRLMDVSHIGEINNNEDDDDKKTKNDDDEDDDARTLKSAMTKSRSGGLVVEGTSGSTGIALASVCAHKGHACLFVLPDDQAQEKRDMLQSLGAYVHVVPTAAIANPKHYVNVAKRLTRRAHAMGISAVFTDQFENLANYQIHHETTGPEIYKACQPHAFCMSAGTGGTIAGVGQYLKEQSPDTRVVLIDPPGSVLYSKIQHGVAFATQQREQALLRHRYDTIAEGIGLDRVTANMQMGLPFIDSAIAVTDQQALDMAHWIFQNEGLWIGSSSAMNLVGAVLVARDMPFKSRLCTILCDGGSRHVTRFWNRDFVRRWGLEWPGDDGRIPECLHGLLAR